jgi:hypothetical protein
VLLQQILSRTAELQTGGKFFNTKESLLSRVLIIVQGHCKEDLQQNYVGD